jgi:O6-methylguanine-DNA--protein-cysteine methyltransferase
MAVKLADHLLVNDCKFIVRQMNIEIVYYQSPVGVLEIRSTGNAISDVLFLNSWKGTKVNEADLVFTKPQSSAIKNCIKQLDEYFSGKRVEFKMEIAQVGTDFQQGADEYSLRQNDQLFRIE